jgi:hypothetical protein
MKVRILAAMILGLFVVPAMAQHGHKVAPRYGGQAFEIGEFHAELVTKADTVELHIADHDNKAQRSVGHKGVAILMIDGKSQRIVLEPAGDSRLSGKASGALPKTVKGVVQITKPDGKTVQARLN